MAFGAYGRPRVGLPLVRAINVFAELTKEGPTRVARIPRPGLTRTLTLSQAFCAEGVYFDGATRLKNAALVCSNANTCSFAFWFKSPVQAPGIFYGTWWQSDPDTYVNGFSNQNALTISGGFADSAGTNGIYINSTDNAFSDDEWHHCLVSVNVSSGTKIGKLYVDGVYFAGTETSSGGSPFTILLNGLAFYLGDDTLDDFLTSAMAEFWFAPGVSLLSGSNIIPAETIAKFIADGCPVDLGDDGSNPTGDVPAIYLSRRHGETTSAFLTNRGTGGDFTEDAGSLSAVDGPCDCSGGAPVNGPVLRMYQNPGLFSGDLFSVAGPTFWRNDTFVSDTPYSLQPRMAAIPTQLALVVGGALYVYDGSTLTLVQYFDDGETRLPPFSSVAVLYNIFVLTVQGSTAFYTSVPGDATTIPALNLNNAQTSPDPIIEVQVLAEELYFFKSKATEIWDFNGGADPAAPFSLSQGRTYIRGTPSQGSVVLLDNALFWVGDNFTVYRTGSTPQRVSTPYIEDLIRQAAAAGSIERLTAFNVPIEGHDFYVVNFPSLNQSFAYDCQTQEWAQWGSQQPFQSEPGLLTAGCAAGQGDALYAGSATAGYVYLWDTTNNTDDGTAIEKLASAYIWTSDGKQRLNSVGLACVRGVGNSDAQDPQVRMRLSKDTRTFGPWVSRSLGGRGEYERKAVWRALGLISQPGVLVEFATTEPVVFVPEGATWNVARY